ncbi:MAG: hypothetical protein HKP37_02400 [Boseongicola sp.]|nr:hypothetical protein [Boseongicola sp.]NNL17570.1 hypothetical protein [Boseongicola sp.]
MSWEQTKLSRLNVASISGLEDQTVAILAVGEPDEWQQSGQTIPRAEGVQFVSINEVNETLLEHLCPTVVISPALSRRFDCIDLAQILCSHRFKGRYRAVSRELPNPSMVEREIRGLCPGLDFAILVDP